MRPAEINLDIDKQQFNLGFWEFKSNAYFSNRNDSQETTQIQKVTFYIHPSKQGAKRKVLL